MADTLTLDALVLKAGTKVYVGGIPCRLLATVTVEAHPANIERIEFELSEHPDRS